MQFLGHFLGSRDLRGGGGGVVLHKVSKTNFWLFYSLKRS